MSIPRGSRSCCRRISRCRRAASDIRWPDPPLEAEQRLHGPKMAAVAAFARANRLDWLAIDPPAARFGIITTGKAYLDVRQALADLGIDDKAAAALGIRLYKVGLTWPLEAAGARRFAEGLNDVLVVEEKRGFIEDQLDPHPLQPRGVAPPDRGRQGR